ncbi:hypothetical protein K502DRAFT_325627 [Neoconidiobolus thromboides FSU 785]|nr:hypothetical protein K502DRAFT_325627 [Neoconidiobolus thromboides FSU 785]
MEKGGSCKWNKESYRNKAISRIKSIETEFNRILKSLKIEGLTGVASDLGISIQKYLQWANRCIDMQRELTHIKHKPRGTQLEKNNIQSKHFQFQSYFTKGFEYYTKQLTLIQMKLYFQTDYSPEVELKIIPNQINGINPLKLFDCFTAIYCQYLDSDALWFSADQINSIFRQKESTLLKAMLVQSMCQLIELPQELKSVLLNFNSGIESKIIQSYANPSLQNVAALALITGEYLFKGDFGTARLYLGQAVRMSELLGVIPIDKIEQTSSFKCDFTETYWKQTLWEILLLLQISLYNVTECPLMFKNIKILPLTHIKNKTLCLPTIARLAKDKITKIEPGNLLKGVDTHNFNFKTPIIYEDVYYHSKALSNYLELSQSYINGRSILKNSSNIYPINRFYFDITNIINMIQELDSEIQTTPQNYKSYRFLSFSQITELHSYGRLQSDNSGSLGSFGYLMLLISKLFIVDPISFISSCPHVLPYDWLWPVGLEAANDLWELFYTLFDREICENEYPWVIASNARDLLPVITFYLNALEQYAFDEKVSTDIVNKIQLCILWLEKDSVQLARFDDSKIACDHLNKRLKSFKIAYKYRFTF